MSGKQIGQQKNRNSEKFRYITGEKTMTDMMNMAINDAALDNVTGGATRTVKNNSLKYANVREGAGLPFPGGLVQRRREK